MTAETTTEQDQLREFVRFSATMTGFSEFDLWGTGQVEAYYHTILSQEGPDALVRAMNGGQTADPLVKSIIKLWYVGVWYGTKLTGRTDVAAWTAPGRSGSKPAVPEDSQPSQSLPSQSLPSRSLPRQRVSEDDSAAGYEYREPPFVVSPAAYTEGLLWRAIGAHPSGTKAPGYGSWVQPPAFPD